MSDIYVRVAGVFSMLIASTYDSVRDRVRVVAGY